MPAVHPLIPGSTGLDPVETGIDFLYYWSGPLISSFTGIPIHYFSHLFIFLLKEQFTNKGLILHLCSYLILKVSSLVSSPLDYKWPTLNILKIATKFSLNHQFPSAPLSFSLTFLSFCSLTHRNEILYFCHLKLRFLIEIRKM